MKRIPIILALILLVAAATATTIGVTLTWSEEQLTTHLSLDQVPCIAQTFDGKIWVAWQNDFFGNFEIVYKIYDGGWGDPYRLTNNASSDVQPSIFQAYNGTIWAFWSSDRTGHYNIFYKTHNGSSWGDAKQLTRDIMGTSEDNAPSAIQAMNGTIWVVWQTDNKHNYDIFYKTSSDGGSSWSQEIPLTTNLSSDKGPSIAQMADGRIWVTWGSDRTGNWEIFSKVYNGSWSNATQLTTRPTISDVDPYIVQARNGTIWIVWTSSNGNDDLYYMTSSDNGDNWSEEQLTSDSSDDQWSSIAQMSDKKIWVVWTSNRDDNYDIYYRTSNEIIVPSDVAITSVTPSTNIVDQGETVSVSVVAENQGTEDKTFVVTCCANSTVIGSEMVSLTPSSSTNLEFLWDTSDVIGGIYTIRGTASWGATRADTLTGGTVFVTFHDVAVMNITPSEPSVGQGYTLKIDVEVKNKGGFTETFNVIAYYNSTAFETQTLTDVGGDTVVMLAFNWNTTGVPLGNYVISATAEPVPGEDYLEDNSLPDGTVRVKIPGDVDGNNIVDVVDLGLIARSMGSNPTWPHGTDWYEWNPDCDINNDLKVTAYDLYVAGKNYLRTA